MNQLVQFTLSPEALKSMGALTSAAKNVLSPFENGRKLDQAQVAALQKSNILNVTGLPMAEIGATLDRLAAPASFAQLRLQAGPEFFEHIAFHSPDGAHTVLLTTSGTDVLVSDPAPVPDLVELAKQYIGTSVLRAPTFDAELEYGAAVVLAAAIDLYRRAAFRALADEAEFASFTFDAPAIDAAIANAPEDWHCFLGIMASIPPGIRSIGNVGSLLEKLVAAGHLLRDGVRFQLGETVAQLAGRFPLVELLLSINTGQLGAGGEVIVTQLLCLQAGLHDLLTIEGCDGNVRFECLSAAGMVEYVNQVFTDPKILTRLSTPKSAACPRCHAPLIAGAKFCAHCGFALESSCRQCGATLTPTARFCAKCGTAVAPQGG